MWRKEILKNIEKSSNFHRKWCFAFEWYFFTFTTSSILVFDFLKRTRTKLSSLNFINFIARQELGAAVLGSLILSWRFVVDRHKCRGIADFYCFGKIVELTESIWEKSVIKLKVGTFFLWNINTTKSFYATDHNPSFADCYESVALKDLVALRFQKRKVPTLNFISLFSPMDSINSTIFPKQLKSATPPRFMSINNRFHMLSATVILFSG